VNYMKIKVFLLCIVWLFWSNIQARETDSLWNTFMKELDEIVLQEKAHPAERFDNSYSRNGKIINILMNSPIEERGLEYMFQNFGRDSLPNVRDFLRGVFYQIARKSDNQSARKTAIKYNFALPEATIRASFAFEPNLLGTRLGDFDDNLKQELMKQYTRQFTDEELTFYAESQIKYWKRHKNDYDIRNVIKKHQDTISYEEGKKILFDSLVFEYKERLRNAMPSDRIMVLSGRLHLQEAIPYLKEYANDNTFDRREYAIYALATMRVEDYEDRAVTYFDIDAASNDTWIARIINSQKIWYAYMRRLKSEKYDGFCPVAYSTIRHLGDVLKDFPITDRPWFEGYFEFDDGMRILIPSKIEPVRIVPDECGMSNQKGKTLINLDHIKVVVDWMEANKGKYELQ
jgi:hypothetical protein